MTASGIRIGISACLLRQQVRDDGGHERACLRDLGVGIQWVAV